MRIAFDAKRYYHNNRGLGNYSRDVVRLIRTYAPEWELQLIDKSGIGRSFMPCPICDIYHGLSGEIPLQRSSWSNIKTIVTMHDAIFVRYPELYSPTYRWLFAQKVRYACTHADVIIAISEQTKRDLMEFFDADEAKIHVIYQGCSNIFRQHVSELDKAAIQHQYLLPSLYILIVGAVEARKNLKGLIQAVAAAKIDIPIIAVGSRTRYADEAEALARQLHVTLRILSNVPFTQLPAFYSLAEMMVYPSHFEGFGIPILEAMCMNTPVITSTGSCFHEVAGEAALYANPTHPEQLGEHIYTILNDNKLKQRLIETGQKQSQLFSDEQVAHNLIQVYESTH